MRSFFQMLLALLTLTVMVWVVWQGYLLLRQEQLGLAPGTRSVLIISIIAGIICTFMITNAISNHGNRVMRGHQFTKRLALYEKCLDAWQSAADEVEYDHHARVALNFAALDAQLALMASAKVIKAFRELQEAAVAEGIHTPVSAAIQQRLLLAMREDLGPTADYFVRKEIQHLSK